MGLRASATFTAPTESKSVISEVSNHKTIAAAVSACHRHPQSPPQPPNAAELFMCNRVDMKTKTFNSKLNKNYAGETVVERFEPSM